MRFLTQSVCALSVAAATLAAPVSASVLSGDFRGEFDLPDASFGAGARVLENLNTSVGAGQELDEDDETQNLSTWFGGVSADLSASGLLTLTGQGGDFDFARISIENMSFNGKQEILDVIEVGTSNILDPGYAQPTPTIRFGEDHFSLSIDTTGAGNISDFFFVNGGTAQFQFVLSPVPVPAGVVLLGTGLLAFGVARRRKRVASVPL